MRLVQPNTTVHAQPELGIGPGYAVSTFQVFVVHQDVWLPTWTVVDGLGVADTAVRTKFVYIKELGDGEYLFRWRPNASGTWLLDIIVDGQSYPQEFDVGSLGSC